MLQRTYCVSCCMCVCVCREAKVRICSCVYACLKVYTCMYTGVCVCALPYDHGKQLCGGPKVFGWSHTLIPKLLPHSTAAGLEVCWGQVNTPPERPPPVSNVLYRTTVNIEIWTICLSWTRFKCSCLRFFLLILGSNQMQSRISE